jgi:hypothetical protein
MMQQKINGFTFYLAVLFVGIVSMPPPVFAIDLYGFGSYWDRDDVEGAWGGGVGASLPLLIDYLRLDGRIYFFENSKLGPDDELTLMPVDLGLQVHILPDRSIDPYLLGGISYLYADADKIDVDSKFGAYLGAGVDVELNIPFFKIFAEAMYRFNEIDSVLADDPDVSGFTGNIGLKFNF